MITLSAQIEPRRPRNVLPDWNRAALTYFLGVVVLAGLAREVAAQDAFCTHRTGVQHTDPSGEVFDEDWVCGNTRNAAVYAGPAKGSGQVSVMQTTNSWFLCWVHGEQHSGGNDIWYYTRGDTGANPWGFMPASSLYEDQDPWPGMPSCDEPAPNNPSEVCSHRSGVYHTDQLGTEFTQDWVCRNAAQAAIYAGPAIGTGQVSTMSSTESWFVCWVHGEQHRGGNDIWYYTEGDTGTDRWGFMPASSLYEDNDPWPGMPSCQSLFPAEQHELSEEPTVESIGFGHICQNNDWFEEVEAVNFFDPPHLVLVLKPTIKARTLGRSHGPDDLWKDVNQCMDLSDLAGAEVESLKKQLYCHALYNAPKGNGEWLGGPTWDLENKRENISWARVVLTPDKCNWTCDPANACGH